MLALSAVLEPIGGAVETADGNAGSTGAVGAEGVTGPVCAAVRSANDVVVASLSVLRASWEG